MSAVEEKASVEVSNVPEDAVSDKIEGEESIEVVIGLPDGRELIVPGGAYPSDTSEFVRSILQDTQETCHLTSFSLSVSGGENDSAVLNEFNDLGSYLSNPEEKKLRLQLQTIDYTTRSVREHVKRCRGLLKFPTLKNSIESPADTEAKAKEESKSAETPLPTVTVDEIVKPRAVGLSNFYDELLSRVGKPNAACLSAGVLTGAEHILTPSDVIKSVSESGWNAPTAARSMQGDLLYLEVVTASEGVLQLTCTAAGFFVNRSSRSNFDPRPAASPCFSHELLHTLFAASPMLAKAWATQLARLTASQSSTLPLDALATLIAQGQGDVALISPQWNVPPTGVCGTTATAQIQPFDTASAQDMISSRFGVDASGPPREWNEDLQTARSIPAEDQGQRLMRDRIANKTIHDFRLASEAAVKAIVDGHISAFNPMDPPAQHVFLHNGIFFSGAVDTKDTFKLAQGEVSCRKYAGHDLKNQRRVQALELPGLHTVVQMLIDYKGSRLVAQTIIPGVLSASVNASRLMLGAVERGQRLHVKKEALDILQELGRRVGVAQRNVSALLTGDAVVVEKASAAFGLGLGIQEPASPIRIDAEDEVAPADATSMPHLGPIEGKIIKGTDGRNYALEIVRLTPRDANYVPSTSGGTGLLDASTLDTVVDADMAGAYLLRHELIEGFLASQLEVEKQAVVKTHIAANAQRKNELVAALAKKTETAPPAENADARDPLELQYEAEQAKVNATFLEEIAALEAAADTKDFRTNPNLFFPGLAADVDPAVVAQDEATARQLAEYLHNIVCPAVTSAVRNGSRQPLDCAAAAKVLHDTGINMRYLGRMARLAREEERTDLARLAEGSVSLQGMPTFWRELLEAEIVARSVKILLNSMFSAYPTMKLIPAPTIAAVLSAVLSSGAKAAPAADASQADTNPANSSESKKKKKSKGKAKAADSSMDVPVAFNAVDDAQEIVADLEKVLKGRFLYSLGEVRTTVVGDYNSKRAAGAEAKPDQVEGGGALGNRLPRLMVLRRICQQCGVRVASRDYQWDSAAPLRADDIIELVPRVKSCEGDTPSSDAALLIARSQQHLKSGLLAEAYGAAQEATNLLTQVAGPLHTSTVDATSVMAVVLQQAGDAALALLFNQKILQSWVQLRGFDSPEAVMSHLELAQLHVDIGSVTEALPHLLAARYSAELTGGIRHPLMVTIFQKIAEYMALAPVPDSNVLYSLLCHARDLCSSVVHKAYFGVMVSNILRNLAYYEEAIKELSRSHFLLQSVYGEDDARAKELKEQLVAMKREITEIKVMNARAEQQNAAENAKKLELLKREKSAASARKELESVPTDAQKKYQQILKQKRARR